MSVPARHPADLAHWAQAGSLALCAHLAAGALAIAWVPHAEPLPPEPVVLVELPPAAVPQPEVSRPREAPPPAPVPPPPAQPALPVTAPPVAAPLPSDPVVLPPPVMVPAPADAPEVPTPAAGPVVAPAPVADVALTQKEIDYFTLISAHLNRRKQYPAEARKARQQGVVTVRFTIDRSGNVTAASIKRSSGHALLDAVTLDLLHRVSPLPGMPKAMKGDSVTLSLPIDYSLKTN